MEDTDLFNSIAKKGRKSKKQENKTNEALGLDDLTLGIIQVYFKESGLTVKEYTMYMNKQYKGINLRMSKNQMGWTTHPESAKARIREIKQKMRDSPDVCVTVFRSLQRFKNKTIRKRRGPRVDAKKTDEKKVEATISM
jgi:hypothetical protein